MKPLILMLLFVVPAGAQSLPEVARKERERQAVQKPVRVFISERGASITTTPEQTGKPVTEPASAPAATTSTPPPNGVEKQQAAPAVSPAATAAEALRKYNEDLSKLRAKVVELQDQETALQLQINDLKNQFLAPISDSNAQAQAQAKLDQAQIQLTNTQRDLAATRRQVELLEAQGPPKP
jgi:hypothetical protein